MNKYKKLVSNTLILGAGTLSSKIIVLLMMPFYTMILSPEQFGVADIVTQTANMIIPIACIGVCEGLFRFTLDCDDRKKVFTTSLAILGLGSAASFVLLPALSFFDSFDGYILLIGAYVICANFHSACAQYVRAQGRTTLFAAQGIINTLLTVILNVIFLAVFKWGSFGYVLSVIIGDITVTLIIFFVARLYRDISPKHFSKDTFKELLKFSLPYIPTTMLWLITSVSDRYIVKYFCGIDATGLYAASYKIPTLLTLACGVVIEAWQFSAVKDADDGEREKFFGTVFKCYLGVVFVAASVLIGGSKLFTQILLADSYYNSWSFVPILVMATVFSTLVSFMGSVYFVEKKSILSMITAMMGAVINIILNFVMIPDHGAMGAAVATLISYLAVYILRAYDTRKYVKFNLHTILLCLNMLLIVAQAAIMYSGVRYHQAVQVVMIIAVFALNSKGIFALLREFLGFLPIKKKKTQNKS